MSVKIRLKRVGTTKRPYYRIIAIDSREKRSGRELEILGTYDPLNTEVAKNSEEKEDKGRVSLKSERIKYWLGVGAQVTPTVNRILKRSKIAAKTAA